MNQNTYILIGLCIFCLLLGTRLKKRFGVKDRNNVIGGSDRIINKNQRSKIARKEYPTGRYRNRDKVKKIFTWFVLVVLFLLVLFMIPSLVRDFMISGKVDPSNLFLRVVIVVAALSTIVMGFLKVNKKK